MAIEFQIDVTSTESPGQLLNYVYLEDDEFDALLSVYPSLLDHFSDTQLELINHISPESSRMIAERLFPHLEESFLRDGNTENLKKLFISSIETNKALIVVLEPDI